MNPVVVIDSGLGGLTVFDAIREQVPTWPLVYCFDNAAFPYGEKSEQAVVERVRACIAKLCRHITPSVVVVACNTASTVVLPILREWLNIPVVGVVPAIKPAASASKNKCIGLLATPGTIERSYTEKLIGSYAKTCHVVRVGSSELVHMAERKLCGELVSLSALHNVLRPFIEGYIVPDHIVLGCTHFPWLLEELKQSVSTFDIRWVSSGKAVAKRVASLIAVHEPMHDEVVASGFMPNALIQHQAFYTKEQVMNDSLQRIFYERNLSLPQCLGLPFCETGDSLISIGL